jgi:hypothetical protein
MGLCKGRLATHLPTAGAGRECAAAAAADPRSPLPFEPPPADVNCLKVPSDLDDDRVVLLSDILPTAWHATELGGVKAGDRVAIWGAGPGAQQRVHVALACRRSPFPNQPPILWFTARLPRPAAAPQWACWLPTALSSGAPTASS